MIANQREQVRFPFNKKETYETKNNMYIQSSQDICFSCEGKKKLSRCNKDRHVDGYGLSEICFRCNSLSKRSDCHSTEHVDGKAIKPAVRIEVLCKFCYSLKKKALCRIKSHMDGFAVLINPSFQSSCPSHLILQKEDLSALRISEENDATSSQNNTNKRKHDETSCSSQRESICIDSKQTEQSLPAACAPNLSFDFSDWEEEDKVGQNKICGKEGYLNLNQQSSDQSSFSHHLAPKLPSPLTVVPSSQKIAPSPSLSPPESTSSSATTSPITSADSSPVLYRVLSNMASALKKPRIAPDGIPSPSPTTGAAGGIDHNKRHHHHNHKKTKPVSEERPTPPPPPPVRNPYLAAPPPDDESPTYLRPSLTPIVPLQALREMIATGSAQHTNVEEAKRYAEQSVLTGTTPTTPVAVTHSKWRSSIALAERNKPAAVVALTTTSAVNKPRPLLTVEVRPSQSSPVLSAVHVVSPKQRDLTHAAQAAIRRSEMTAGGEAPRDEEEEDVPIPTANRGAIMRVNKEVLSAANLRHKQQSMVRTSLSAEDHLLRKKEESRTVMRDKTAIKTNGKSRGVTWIDVEKGSALTSFQEYRQYVSDSDEDEEEGGTVCSNNSTNSDGSISSDDDMECDYVTMSGSQLDVSGCGSSINDGDGDGEGDTSSVSSSSSSDESSSTVSCDLSGAYGGGAYWGVGEGAARKGGGSQEEEKEEEYTWW
jgi:hypothetical protein